MLIKITTLNIALFDVIMIDHLAMTLASTKLFEKIKLLDANLKFRHGTNIMGQRKEVYQAIIQANFE